MNLTFKIIDDDLAILGWDSIAGSGSVRSVKRTVYGFEIGLKFAGGVRWLKAP